MAKGIAWSVITGALTRGLFVVVSIVVARLLHAEAFGKWGMVQTTVAVLTGFASMGIGQALTKHIAELRRTDPVRAGRVMALAWQLVVISNLVMSAGCVAMSGVIARNVLCAPDMTTPVALSSLIAFTGVFSMVLHSSLAGFEAFRQIAVARLWEMLTSVVTMIGLTWRFGLVGTILGFSLGQVVGLAMLARYLARHIRQHGIHLTAPGRWREIRLLWEYSLPSFLSSLVFGPANWYVQAMVVQRADGFAGMSGYTASERWYALVGFVPRHIQLVALPVMSQLKGAGEIERYKKAFLANLAATATVAIIPAVLVSVLSPWIMLLYGPEFADKWDILVVMLGVAVVQSLVGVFHPLFVSHGRVWWIFWFDVMWAVLFAASATMLVPHFGLRGFVWPLLGAYCVDLVAQSLAGWILLNRVPIRR